MNRRIELQVTRTEHKKRLEDFLFDRFTGLSKMYLREVVKNLKCEVNGEFENVGYRLMTNDFVEIELDLTRGGAMRPENVPLEIIFEDDEIVVVNKPAGMLVHPTHRDKNGTLLNALSFYLNAEPLGGENEKVGKRESENEERALELVRASLYLPPLLRESHFPAFSRSRFVRPGLVHRLDKQTSGLMVVAKTARAHRVLADHFKRKLVEKRYLALVDGVVSEDAGTITAPIGRYAEQKYWDVKDDGKHAETRFWVRERYADATLLELEPVTGRTNQLRIHCASVGHSIVGDVKRGGREFPRLCLHAYELAFRHPSGGEWMCFESDDPEFSTLTNGQDRSAD